MSFSYPLPSSGEYIERVDDVPGGARVHRWVLRDDNHQQVQGTLPLAGDPAYLDLMWKADARGREQLVGRFRLHLAALLAAHYVRRDEETGGNVRVRVHRGDRGVVFIQPESDESPLPIGVIDMTLD
jgi:hypothetical protein